MTTISVVLINDQVLDVFAVSSIVAQVEYNAALLSICMVVLLGFIDDVIDLRWRHKLIVPTIASIPILAAYKGLTKVVMPKLLRGLVGSRFLDLGIFYYIFMAMLAIFCTNSINIFAGLNGIEVGQSIIIAADRIVAMGFALPCPAMSGAVPCAGWNTAQLSPMSADGAIPMPPTNPAARSDRMSPYMLVARTTSKRDGSRTR